MKRMLALVGLLAAWFFLGQAVSAADKADTVLDAFLASIKANSRFSPEQKAKAEATIQALRQDRLTRSTAIPEALRELSPEYRVALETLADEKLLEAQVQFKALATDGNAFLAAEAKFQLARALVLQERYEEALVALAAVTGAQADYTLNAGQAWFLRGLCEVAQLKRNEAIAALERFLKEDPHAPERLLIAAARQIELLKLVEEGSLRDVWQRMDFIRRRLALEDAGKETRQRQDEVVALLGKLIEEAEERESQGQGQGQSGEKQGKGQGQGKGKGANSRGSGGEGGGPDGQKNDRTGPNDQTPSASGPKRQYRGPQSAWSMLRENERAQVLQSLKDKFPERYKQLLEQYYKNVQDEEEP